MTFRLAAAVCAFFLGIAGQALGQSWVPVTTDQNRNQFELEMGSITVNGGFTQSWMRQTLVRPQRDAVSGKSYSNVVIQRLDDCRARTFAIVSTVYRDDKGQVLSTVTTLQADWRFIAPPPGSVAAELQARICDVATRRASLTPSLKVGPTTKANWLPTAYDPTAQTRYFVAEGGAILMKEGTVAVIVRADNGIARKLSDGSLTTTGYIGQIYDCEARTVTTLSVDNYDSAGNLVGVFAPTREQMEAQRIVAGASPDLIAKYVCDAKHQVAEEGSEEGQIFVGTGWMGPKGYLITANHVIEDATKLELAYDGRIIGTAEVVVTDPANDIAILKPHLKGPAAVSIPFSAVPARLGERVFTLGYPAPDVLGSALKMTSGEVSAMSGNDAVSGRTDDARFMQVSIPIHSGNSGGPVIDDQGRAVGIVISKMQKAGENEIAQNVNYALKIDYVRSLMVELPTLKATTAATPRASISALVAELQKSVFLVIVTR